MKSSKKPIIVFVILILIIVGIAALLKYLKRTVYYDDKSVNGNYSGNLLNGGSFCEYNGLVYFSNPNDNYYLYSMNPDGSNMKLLEKDSVRSINIAEPYIFYTRLDTNEDTAYAFLNINRYSLCRINMDGSNKVILDNDPCMDAALVGNYVYYIHYNKSAASQFYRIKIDGSEKELLNEQPYNPSCTVGSTIYYTELKDNHNIIAYDSSSKSARTQLKGNICNILYSNNSFYYMDCESNYALTRYSPSKNEKIKLVSKRIECFNVSDKYLYYQLYSGSDPVLCRSNLDGSNEVILAHGNFCEINVTSKFVYFKEYNTNNVYKILEIDSATPIVFQ